MAPPADVRSGSNTKPGTKPDGPLDGFKRAVAGCMRAMAGTAELEVTYAPERPNLIRTGEGSKARLPEPSRKLDPRGPAPPPPTPPPPPAAGRRRPGRHASASTRPSRRASRRSARDACPASPAISRRCSTTG